ncbi:acetoin utilization protein AcuC [Cellulomonas bogoriensis]|uniref:Acetoin utilization protein AcuC n=1 Tax=Cellulomonas bogoriensis 69B4 = DSM 16987 TaxID=1386082 RepID=A0A0A0C011_9CELL|nr:acetoin utilization protein AcuC [Cellulomonas bogoriensis]KGM13540.1 acetoin utilization protein AcuC [Cellulomonas bogoriensis 69B4 = DSM 16987]
MAQRPTVPSTADTRTPGSRPHRARAVWSPELLRYDFGPGHPMAPLRLDLTFGLARELGLLEHLELVGADPVGDGLLLAVHDPVYVEAVRRASDDGTPDHVHGLGTPDNPLFRGMHEAAARVVGGSVDLALAVWRGEVDHAVNLAGGMHHAMRGRASGFCVYNDAAAAIAAVLAQGARRVAYVDLDAHHGDGVERAFWRDPRVLTVSVHESGQTLFPGTGHHTDLGGEGALGTAVNVALPAGTGSAPWLRAVEAVVEPVVRAFDPQVVVSQHGCDAHGSDPLTNLDVSVDAQREAMVRVHDLAHAVADGRWLALGGGGYAITRVVPRVWAHLLGVVAHAPVDTATAVPPQWSAQVQEWEDCDLPATMGDGPLVLPRPWSSGYDPADDVDRVLLAVRAAVAAHLDVDPVYG